MDRYVSGRQRSLKVGIESYSEDLTSLEVIGNVGIGTNLGTSKLTVIGDGLFTGVVTAAAFSGDGSLLTGIVGRGGEVEIRDDNINVGTAATINFGVGLEVSFDDGVVTIDGSKFSNLVEDISNDSIYYPVLSPVTSGSISSISVSSNSIVFNPASNALSIGTTISVGNTTTGSLTLGGKVTFGDGIVNPNLTNSLSLTVGTGYSAYRSLNLTDSSAAVNITRIHDSFGPIIDLKQWNAGITTMVSYHDVISELGLFGIRDRLGEYPPIGQVNRPARTRLFINEFGNVLIGANSSALQVNRTQSVGIGTSNMLQVASGNVYFAGNLGIGTTNPTSKLTVQGDGLFTGVVTAAAFSGDGSRLTGVIGQGSGVQVRDDGNIVGTAATIDFGNNLSIVSFSSGIATVTSSISISTNTTNQNQYLTYAPSIGSTIGLGVTSNLVFNPSTGNLGIGTTNPTATLDVNGAINTTDIKINGQSIRESSISDAIIFSIALG